MKDFHCCATCIHFEVLKGREGTKRVCARLGYETHPKWVFDCWTPKEEVRRLMAKQND